VPGFLRAVRDDAYIATKHSTTGKEVVKNLAKGKEAHVFDDGVDLDALERRVWAGGSFQGQVGRGPRAKFDRFCWRSPTPIGRRVQPGRPDLPLYWVEIKGKIVGDEWVYHLVPRSRPAS
jgi:hypothetical protein